MVTDYQKSILDKMPKERQEFVKKQLQVFDGWMKGNMFMPIDGKCYHCNFDIISDAISKGNDGSKSITGCPGCHRSFCD